MKQQKRKSDTSKRKGRMNTDPVSVQISVRVKSPIVNGVKVKPGKKVLEAAVNQWAETGKAPRGFQVRVVRWRNPARKGSKANWRYADSKDQQQCKLIRRMLRGKAARLAFN